MDTNYLENNYLTLVGKVTGEKKFSHEIYGERFYVFNLEIARLSGNADIIPITVSERLATDEMLVSGKNLLVKGQFRSYNSYENEKNRLILTVFAKDVELKILTYGLKQKSTITISSIKQEKILISIQRAFKNLNEKIIEQKEVPVELDVNSDKNIYNLLIKLAIMELISGENT